MPSKKNVELSKPNHHPSIEDLGLKLRLHYIHGAEIGAEASYYSE